MLRSYVMGFLLRAIRHLYLFYRSWCLWCRMWSAVVTGCGPLSSPVKEHASMTPALLCVNWCMSSALLLMGAKTHSVWLLVSTTASLKRQVVSYKLQKLLLLNAYLLLSGFSTDLNFQDVMTSKLKIWTSVYKIWNLCGRSTRKHKQNKKNPANAKGNAQQRCMLECPVKQNLCSAILATCFFYSRQRAPDERQLIIYSVLFVLARGRHLSRSANAVSARNRKFFLPCSHLAPSLGVTFF